MSERQDVRPSQQCCETVIVCLGDADVVWAVSKEDAEIIDLLTHDLVSSGVF